MSGIHVIPTVMILVLSLASAQQARGESDEVIDLNKKYPEYFAPEVFREEDIPRSQGYLGAWWKEHEALRDIDTNGSVAAKTPEEQKEQLFRARFSGKYGERDIKRSSGAKPQKAEAGHFNIWQIDYVDFEKPICIWGLINHTQPPWTPKSLGLRMCICIEGDEEKFERIVPKLVNGELALEATFSIWKVETEGRDVGAVRIFVKDAKLVTAEPRKRSPESDERRPARRGPARSR